MSQMRTLFLLQLVMLSITFMGEASSDVACSDDVACAASSDAEVLMQTKTKIGTVTRAGNAWTVNPASFSYDMTLSAIVRLNGLQFNKGDAGKLYAFVGEECRGVADGIALPNHPAFGANRGKTLFGLTLYSNTHSGETVTYKLEFGGEVDPISDTMTFTSDLNSGSATNPLVFTATTPLYDEGAWNKADGFMANRFGNSMTFVALVWIDGGWVSDGALAAFVGNDMRGKSSGGNVLSLPPGFPNNAGTTAPRHNMMVYSDSNEQIHFKYKMADGTLKTLTQIYVFASNAHKGDLATPIYLF